MRIGIDMRMAGTGEGIARYVEELVRHLAAVDRENDYYLLVPEIFNQISNPNFQTVKVKSKYYSIAEQTYFIWELMRLKLDLVHFPSFNVPVFYPGKFVVTIHDVIHHRFPGRKKSRLLHRLAYKLVIWSAIKRAAKIISVSRQTKKEIESTFSVDPGKIEVIPEGVSERFLQTAAAEKIDSIRAKYVITKPFLLSVGVWRQYKNFERLALAFDILKDKYGHDMQLVLAGKIDPFYPEIKQAVENAKNSADIKPLGFVDDEDLAALYQGADVFVLPSLVEGFGLIGIEAQASGLAVAASDIPVLREILGEGAAYFNPESIGSMAEVINLILTDSETNKNIKSAARANSKKYDWQKTAQATKEIYERD